MIALYHSAIPRNLSNFLGLAACLGIEAQPVEIEHCTVLASTAEAAGSDCEGTLILDVSSIAKICDLEATQDLARVIAGTSSHILLLVTSEGDDVNRFMAALSTGAVSRVGALSAAETRFSPTAVEVARELCGQSYSRKGSPSLGLKEFKAESLDVIMTLDVTPSFARLKIPNSNVFVWSTSTVFDATCPLETEVEFEEATDEYIPAIMFLRMVFGERCWHNPYPAAGFVIDDPLLRRRYGYIDFRQLLTSARKHAYHVTLAFIPWNHWRTRRSNARFFLYHSDCISLCAHGYDHTKNEFAVTDRYDLLNRSFGAIERMEFHRQRTGLPYEALMVYPQEQYSKEALWALAESRQFTAVVNTRCIPPVKAPTGEVCGADLLLPAQDSWFGLPILKRHYWTGMADFAMALFLGKPAILVEHHEYFREGTRAIEEFVSKLRGLRPDIRWVPISTTVRRLCLQQRISEHGWRIRFFADSFEFEHRPETSGEYHLIRRLAESAVIESVTVNGAPVTVERNDDFLRCTARVNSPGVVRVRVQVSPACRPNPVSPSLRYQAGVAVRRVLSEFRDNVVSRNDFALRMGRALMRSLHLS